MPKDWSDDQQEPQDGGKTSVRSTKEIKAGMLRRAFDGQSKYSPTEVISMILAANHRSKNIPEEHRAVLNEIDISQPRSVLMLNAISRHLGNQERYIDATTAKPQVPGPLTLQ